MQYFVINRFEDVSKISGCGIVAEGIIWSDGTVAYRWLSDIATTVIANCIEDVKILHGHDGKSEVRILAELPNYPYYIASKQPYEEEVGKE